MAKRLVLLTGGLGLMLFVAEQYIQPTVDNSLRPLREMVRAWRGRAAHRLPCSDGPHRPAPSAARPAAACRTPLGPIPPPASSCCLLTPGLAAHAGAGAQAQRAHALLVSPHTAGPARLCLRLRPAFSDPTACRMTRMRSFMTHAPALVLGVRRWLAMFYTLFDLWLNILAETLRFGDREFYKARRGGGVGELWPALLRWPCP